MESAKADQRRANRRPGHSETLDQRELRHALAGLDLSDRVHHADRGAIGDRQRRGLFETHRIGNPDELMRLGAAEFGKTAVLGLAHQAALDAVDRIDQNAIAVEMNGVGR